MSNVQEKVSITASCTICLKNTAKYTCPRCNVKYCELSCYRSEKHQRCSEAFYRDCFLDGMKEMEATKKGKEQLADILRRVQMQDEVQSYVEGLHERLSDLNLDTDIDLVWSRLNAKEQQEFNSLLHEGRVGSLITPWQPWWMANVPLVESDSSTEPASAVEPSSDSVSQPTVLSTIPPLDSLLRGKTPSECISYNVCNVLYGFAYTARLYNGDLAAIPNDCVDCILTLSSALQRGNFSNAVDAVNAGIIAAQNKRHSYFVSSQFSVAVVQDVVQLISSRNQKYVLIALSEAWRFFKSAKRESSRNATKAEQSERKQMLFAVLKKLEFLLSWSLQHHSTLCVVVPQLEVEFCRLSSELVNHEQLKTEIESHLHELKPKSENKPLIEEL